MKWVADKVSNSIHEEKHKAIAPLKTIAYQLRRNGVITRSQLSSKRMNKVQIFVPILTRDIFIIVFNFMKLWQNTTKRPFSSHFDWIPWLHPDWQSLQLRSLLMTMNDPATHFILMKRKVNSNVNRYWFHRNFAS